MGRSCCNSTKCICTISTYLSFAMIKEILRISKVVTFSSQTPCGIRAGPGRAGQGRAGPGRAGQGRAGQGRAQEFIRLNNSTFLLELVMFSQTLTHLIPPYSMQQRRIYQKITSSLRNYLPNFQFIIDKNM